MESGDEATDWASRAASKRSDAPRRSPLREVRDCGASENYSDKNVLRLAFTLSDLVSLVAVAGAAFVILGFLRVFLIGTFLGVPFQDYYAVSDYLASSMYSFGWLAIGVVFAAILMGVSIANAHSFAYQSRRASGRWTYDEWISFLFVALNVYTLISHAIRTGRADSNAILILLLVSLIAFGWRAANRYFAKPMNVGFLFAVLSTAVAGTVAGAVAEINRGLDAPEPSSWETVTVVDGSAYRSTEWRTVAITSEFLILRNFETGAVLALPSDRIVRIGRSRPASAIVDSVEY